MRRWSLRPQARPQFDQLPSPIPPTREWGSKGKEPPSPWCSFPYFFKEIGPRLGSPRSPPFQRRKEKTPTAQKDRRFPRRPSSSPLRSAPGKLAVVQRGIRAPRRQQRPMGSLFHDVPLVHHQDQVRVHDGGQPVGDDKAGSPPHQGLHDDSQVYLFCWQQRR